MDSGIDGPGPHNSFLLPLVHHVANVTPFQLSTLAFCVQVPIAYESHVITPTYDRLWTEYHRRMRKERVSA